LVKGKPGFPDVQTLEERGRTWAEASDEYPIGFVMELWGTDAANQTPATLEMQRRSMAAVRAASDSADVQAQQVIKLTIALKIYTIVLVLVGLV
jgi:hypothetical protein